MRTFLFFLLISCSFVLAGHTYATAKIHQYSAEGSVQLNNLTPSLIQQNNPGKEIYPVTISLLTCEDTDDDYDFSSAKKKIFTQHNHLSFTDNLFRHTVVTAPVNCRSFCNSFSYITADKYILQRVIRI